MAQRVRAAHPGLGEAEVAAIVAEARAVLALPEMSAPVVRREVDAIGDVMVDGEVRRAVGRIDRLQIGGGRALVIDYKTDRIVPASAATAPLVYRRQLAVYRTLVAAMLPGLSVEAAIVWTARPAFMAMGAALPTVRVA
jgi:ATP-dependent helicase/nuclease subunit A